MIKAFEGNAVDALLNGDIDVLLHCANCQRIMGSGIAKEIAARFPEAMLVDLRSPVSPEKRFGSITMGQRQREDGSYMTVINLYGQLYPGFPQPRPVHYGALAKAMQQASGFARGLRIGIPYKMASDRAGGDWDVVFELIQFIFAGCDVTIYKLPQ